MLRQLYANVSRNGTAEIERQLADFQIDWIAATVSADHEASLFREGAN
jgi:hypothetical protein